jgi:hypothetical protein
MRKPLLILLGLAGMLRADESLMTIPPVGVATNSAATNAAPAASPAPTTENAWTNVPKDCWGDNALPYAQAGLKAWHQETDPKKKEEIGAKVLELANRADATDIGLELFAGRPVAQMELPVPTNSIALPLTAFKEWDLTRNEYDTSDACVIRRIGPKNFEIWTPKFGWLFDENGKVFAEAKVPRRDGTGRQWYGAFLPDGQWITTDLWERDDRIYLFSKDNRLLNSFPAGDIAGWGRSDSTGTHWVVGVSGYGHLYDSRECSDLKISPWGWRQRVAHFLERWHLPLPDPSWKFVVKIKSARDFVDPRNLGSRGICCGETSESDDRKASISWDEPGHGRWVGWPHYSMNTSGHGWESCIPLKDTDNLGFFPGSCVAWVGGNKYPVPLGRWYRKESFRSWIIDPDGKVLGWLPAERVADDPDGKRMWFVDEQGRLLNVASDGKVSEVLQPTLAGATENEAPFAHVLFPNLKLGFFYTKPGHLLLAKWNSSN